MDKFILLLLLQITLAKAHSAGISFHNFQQLFKSYMTARNQRYCSGWVEILDHSVFASNFDNLKESMDPFIVVKDLTTENQTLIEPKYKFGPLHLHMPCLLVSVNLTHTRVPTGNPILTSWPLVPNRPPGHQRHVYHLIWLDYSFEDLSNITSSLVTLPNPFILLRQTHLVTIFTRNLNPKIWYEAGEYKNGVLSLSIQGPNFKGSSVVGMVCTVCAEVLEKYKELGVWIDPLSATLYYLTTDFNGTLTLEGVFGLPFDGTNEDGEWDGYVQPLIDGTAVFATTVKSSPSNQHIIHHTKQVHQYSVSFITARPKRIQYSVLEKLYQPLDSTVWLAILISLVAVVGGVEILYHARVEKTTIFPPRRVSYLMRKIQKQPLLQRENHKHVNTIHAILEPLVDQSGLRSKLFSYNIRKASTRMVVGLWFLLVIVLNTCYRSMMTSVLVRPAYSRPPTTFRELVASDYHIGCVFFEGYIGADLEALNSSMSRQLLQRMYSYEYFEPECYQMIFERQMACIGYGQVFDLLGVTFMVDVRYQNMALFSKEQMFPGFTGFGVSLRFPAIVDPLNRYMSAFTESGIDEKWWENGRLSQRRLGQKNAKKFAEAKSYYRGISQSMKDASDETRRMFLQLVGFGILVATCGFLFEFLYFFLMKLIMYDQGSQVVKYTN